MPKRKSLTGRKEREKRKLIKRQQKQNDIFQDEIRSQSPADLGSPRQGSIGLPPLKEKPMARVQASPCERMHSASRLSPPRGSRLIVTKDKVASPDSPAWVCAPPRVPESDIWKMSGSAGQAQLIPSKGEEVSRALKKDERHIEENNKDNITENKGNITENKGNIKKNKGNIAENKGNLKKNKGNIRKNKDNTEENKGNTKEYKGDIEKTKKNIEESKKYTGKPKTYTEKSKIYTVKSERCDRNAIEIPVEEYYGCIDRCETNNTKGKKFEVKKNGITCMNENNVNRDRKASTTQVTSRISDDKCSKNFNLSVQGSFHQGDPMFGENAGTQCVANSLTALAYHKLKNCEQWQSEDMNKILATGDEMYSYLQCSSTIANRYLLVNELPQFFECFGRMFEFKANESLPSLINLAGVVLNYDDFNAYQVLDALQIALDDNDGCFVCFGGNTFLIGKCHRKFFTFDSHSRSSAGFQSVNGRSTRVLYESVQDLCNHILSLAMSMGYSQAVECEITGVQCSMKRFSLEEGIKKQLQISDEEHEMNKSAEIQCNISSTGLKDADEVQVVGSDQHQIRFLPLSNDQKKTHCEILRIPYAMQKCENQHQYGQEITVPMTTVPVEPDGNCFFRAISFCLTGKQDYHHSVRLAVCHHLLENSLLFTSFLRPGQTSIENHISSSGMSMDGKWATELEILALSIY